MTVHTSYYSESYSPLQSPQSPGDSKGIVPNLIIRRPDYNEASNQKT